MTIMDPINKQYNTHRIIFLQKLAFKKLLITISLVILFAMPVFSQTRFGIRVGGIASLVPIYDITRGFVGAEPAHKWGTGIDASIFLSINTESMYFQPEISFESTTYEYIVIDNYVTSIVKQNFDKLNIPLLFGIQLETVRFFLGPSPSIKLVLPEAFVDNPDFYKIYDKISLDYQVGFAIEILEKIDLELRYRGFLGKNVEGVEKLGYQTFTLNKSNSSIFLSVGYIF
jgi:hypothetical protein